MEYYLEGKRNELSSHEQTWRKFKGILLSEKSQLENAAYCMVPNTWHSEKGKTMDIVKNSVVSGMGKGGDEYMGHRIYRWKYSYDTVMIDPLYICQNP